MFISILFVLALPKVCAGCLAQGVERRKSLGPNTSRKFITLFHFGRWIERPATDAEIKRVCATWSEPSSSRIGISTAGMLTSRPGCIPSCSNCASRTRQITVSSVSTKGSASNLSLAYVASDNVITGIGLPHFLLCVGLCQANKPNSRHCIAVYLDMSNRCIPRIRIYCIVSTFAEGLVLPSQITSRMAFTKYGVGYDYDKSRFRGPSASIHAAMCSCVCPQVKLMRRHDSPSGTVGGRIAGTSRPTGPQPLRERKCPLRTADNDWDDLAQRRTY